MAVPGDALPPDPQLYHALLDRASDLVAIIEVDGVVRYASPSFQRILGYAPDELLGVCAFTLVHPDDLARVEASYSGAANSPEPVTVQCRYRHADGSWRVIEATASNYLDDPIVRGFVVNGRDVTERVQAEERLREKEAQYRSIFESTTDGLLIADEQGYVVEANPAFCAMLGYAHDELVGLHVTAFVHPDYHHLLAGLAPMIRSGVRFQTEAVDCRKDGSAIPVEIRGATFLYKGAPHLMSVVRDVSERVHAYESLEQRVSERTHELSTLLDVSHNVASTLELQPLLALILDQLKDVVEYRDASILTMEGDELEILAYWGPVPAEQLVGRRFALARAAANRRVIESKEPLIVADLWADDPLSQAFQRVATADLGASMDHMRAWIGVPLLLKDRIIGMLSLAYDEPSYYTSRHAALALAIANQAAVAIENARLYERAQEVAALEERQRLARELHDSVSQALYGIALGVRTARALLDCEPGRAAEPLEYVLSLADAGLTEMRALIFELRPEALAAEGLVAALEKQIDFVRARHGIMVHASLDAEPIMPYTVKEALYRIAQEALHNTVKHARARWVGVRLERRAGELILEVRDDGAGFDPARPFPGHLGLQTMRERATRLKGTLEVRSAPGHGTRIRARIPTVAVNSIGPRSLAGR